MAKSVIDNKSNITWFEKNIKNTIAFSVLAFIFVANYGNKTNESGFSIWLLFSTAVLKDASRELFMLFASMGLFFGAFFYNRYLDKCDQEEYEAEMREEKEEKEKKDNKDKKEKKGT